MDENDHQFPTIWLLCVSATSMQGMSLSSRGSGSSLEPLSGTSSASHSHSFRTPDNMAIGNVTVSSANQPPLAAASNIDANRLMQQLQQQQQQQQQQQAVAGGQISATSGASGNSQPGSLDSLLNFMGSMPISSLMNVLDTNAIQSFLEQGGSFSSGDGGSNSMADVSVPQDLNLAAGVQVQPIDPAQQQADFLEVQAALDALNKTSWIML